MKAFTLENMISKLSGRNTAAMRRILGGTNLGLRRSCSAGDCLLYTSDAADEEDSVDLVGRRIIKKKKK